jgi:hypothetical protein
MALAAPPYPFGLRDVKLVPLDDAGVPGTAVDLPAARTLAFAETEDFEELRGDDAVVAGHGNGPTVTWSLEAGGISLEAYRVMAGGTISSAGVTPNIIKSYKKLGSDSRPYFIIKGQSISDSGGDVHGIIYKAKAEGDIGGEFGEGAFFLTGASGRGFADITGDLYDFVQHETATAIT